MKGRKGLTKVPGEVKKFKSIKIDDEINDNDIWNFKVSTATKTFNIPCKKATLMNLYNNQKEDYNVKILGRWINNDGRKYFDMENKNYIKRLLTIDKDVDRKKLKIAFKAVSEISELSYNYIAKICLINIIINGKPETDTLELLREIYRTYESNK